MLGDTFRARDTPHVSVARHNSVSCWSRCSPLLNLESVKYQIPALSASISIEKQQAPSHGTSPSGTSPKLTVPNHKSLLPTPPRASLAETSRKTFWSKGWCYQLCAGAVVVACLMHLLITSSLCLGFPSPARAGHCAQARWKSQLPFLAFPSCMAQVSLDVLKCSQ